MLYKIVFVVLLIITLCSCSSCTKSDFQPDITKDYKHNIYIKNKEYEGEGVLVLPKKELYTIVFESDGRLDFFIFKTCSREIQIEDARRGLSRKQVTINYRPNEIERDNVCPIHVQAFAEDSRNASGFIDFEDDQSKLPCRYVGGERWDRNNGVSG